MLLQPVVPVVRVVESPTPEVSYGSVLLSALGVVGVVIIASLLVGVLAGGLFIAIRNRRSRSAEDGMTGSHGGLDLHSLRR